MWKTGDYIINGEDKRKILFAGGELIVVSYCNKFEQADFHNYTQKELEKEGYKLVEEDWLPTHGYRYWFVSGDGIIEWSEWVNDNSDKGYIKMGNCFKSKEQAEAYKQKLINLK